MHEVQNAKIRALSAAVPHMGRKYQKNLAVATKLMEIREICRQYDGAQVDDKPNLAWKQNVINAILPYASEKKQHTLRTLLQILEAQEMIANFEAIKEMMK